MKKKVLIFNQDIDELSVIRQVLVREGYEAITASNWDTATKLFASLEIDYVLMNGKSSDIQRVLQNALKM
ncbi:MAG TPA: hypothetical protein PLH27_16395 [bacterium]|nr:hypothetical protein [bacterium]HNB09272.1 hypothetical protein [bacterium]HNB57727.1 hypothetical protein [bacterium]HNC50571.1 hypothetical protein [bacterium]HNJ72129.1 hypothetical protein [bacterium]